MTIRTEQEGVEDQLRRNDVTMLSGEGYFVDPHTIGVRHDHGEARYSAEFILIAVGTFPAAPPTVAVDGAIVLTSDDVLKLKTLPKTMVVVGAGVIGIEYAA